MPFGVVRKMQCIAWNMGSDYLNNIWLYYGPGSSIGIATDYGLHGPGIESRWGARFSACPDRPWGPPTCLYNGYQVFPGGVKYGHGVLLTTYPLLVPWS